MGQTLFLAPAGAAAIYFSASPSQAYWNDPGTYGEPVATFVRNAGMGQTADGFVSDTFTFSADLVSSQTFTLNGKQYNFRNLIPHGMTCFETGMSGSSAEAGACIAKDAQ